MSSARATSSSTGRTLAARLPPGEASEYLTVDPGSYGVQVTRPGGGGSPLAEGQVTLAAGTASTAIVVGSGGQPVEIVVTDDAVARSGGGARPRASAASTATARRGRWLCWRRCCAGALGGGAYRLARRRVA